MTIHNQLGQYTALSRQYALALGIDPGGLERASESLTPTFPLFELPEYAYARGELWGCMYGVKGAGGAGTYSGIGVGSPAGSGLIIVVEPASTVMVESGAAAYVGVYAMLYADFATSYPTSSAVYCTDLRRVGSVGGAPAGQTIPITGRVGSPVALPTLTLGLLYCDQSISLRENLESVGPIVVHPGGALVIASVSANTDLRGNIRVRVRDARPGEANA